MKKLLIGVGIVAVVGGIIGLNMFMTQSERTTAVSADALQTMTLQGESISDSLIVAGKVEPAQVDHIYLDMTIGEVDEVYVEEGEVVEKGDPLFSYKSEALDEQIEQLQRQQQRLNIQKQQLDAQKKRYRDNLTQAEKDLKEAKDVGNDFEQKQLEDSIDQIKWQQDDLGFQERLLSLDIEDNNQQLEKLKKEKEKLVVESQFDGFIQEVNEAEQHRQGMEQKPFIVVQSNEASVVRGTMSEYDSVFVKEGQTVIVKAKVLSDLSWKGTIKHVDHTPIQNNSMGMGSGNDITFYAFTVELTEAADELLHGYNVSIEVLTETKEDAVLIPFDAIVNDRGTDVVYVLADGMLQRREIETGQLTENGYEVVDGLAIGDELVLNPSLSWGDETEVSLNDSAE